MTGKFDYSNDATYTVTGTEFFGSRYEHILYNKDILVKLDQNGIDRVQADPTAGMFVVDRGESVYSKWLCFIRDGKNTLVNFARPSFAGKTAKKYSVTYAPEKATYTAVYGGITVQTEFFVPRHGHTVVCTVAVTNTSKAAEKLVVTPAIMPKPMPARSAPWDKPEWYMRTSTGREKNGVLFLTRCMSPAGDSSARRAVCVQTFGENPVGREFLLERFAGDGDFFRPDAIEKGLSPFTDTTDVKKLCGDNSASGYLPAYAVQYEVSLLPNETKTFTQVLRFGSDADEVCALSPLADEKARAAELESLKRAYNALFDVHRIKTGDKMFDYFINGYLPLQLEWVSGLDRGWPTGMRGTRDASNDCMGLLVYGDGERARKTLLHLFACQRRDGWFPRQCGEDENGPHDMRRYCDGGVYVLEFLYEFLAHTGDFTVLERKIGYLDGDENDTVLDHAARALDWYLAKENVGIYGLVKIYEGDWFDGVNRAGLKGDGVSVTASAQLVMAVKYFAEILNRIPDDVTARLGETAVAAALNTAESGDKRVQTIRSAIAEHAFNGEYFNSVRNDDGKWIFSNCDPDGKTRMYGPVNSFVIFSGCAPREQAGSAYKNYARLKTENGYVMFDPPFDDPINGVGRVASGDVLQGLWGNGSIYNHGSQGFFCRACAAVGDAEALRGVLKYLLPYDESVHPTELTKSAPYAIVNCYQNSEVFRSRAGMAFLTGTTAYTARIVYEWMFGIRPVFDGIAFDPCIAYDRAELKYTFRGKRLNIAFERYDGKDIKVRANGKTVTDEYTDVLTDRSLPMLSESELYDGIKITVFIPKEREIL